MTYRYAVTIEPSPQVVVAGCWIRPAVTIEEWRRVWERAIPIEEDDE